MTKSISHTALQGHDACGRRGRTLLLVAAVAAAVLGVSFAGMERLRADEPPPAQEGLLEPFLGEPQLDVQPLFQGGRFPSVVVALDGTVLAFWGRNTLPRLRRSEDGGGTWGLEIEVGDNPEHAGRRLGAAVVDETTGDVIVFMDGTDGDWERGHAWRSRDHGTKLGCMRARRQPSSSRTSRLRSRATISSPGSALRTEPTRASRCGTASIAAGCCFRPGSCPAATRGSIGR